MKKMLLTRTFVALCLMCMSGVVADDCAPYVDANFQLQKGQICVLSFCAGTCSSRYCSIIPGTALDQFQFMCLINNFYVIIGISVLFVLIFIGGIISCFFKSMFLCLRASNQIL